MYVIERVIKIYIDVGQSFYKTYIKGNNMELAQNKALSLRQNMSEIGHSVTFLDILVNI